MDAAPEGWRDVMSYNAALSITCHRSMLIEGEQLNNAVYYKNGIISSVCDQEAADLYNDFVTLSTGKHYNQFVNNMIKGFEYIEYLLQ